MSPKTLVTVVILAFVAVSVVYLVVKEVRGAGGPAVAARAPEAEVVATGERESGTAGTETAAALAAAASSDVASDERLAPPVTGHKVVVTYYYTSKR